MFAKADVALLALGQRSRDFRLSYAPFVTPSDPPPVVGRRPPLAPFPPPLPPVSASPFPSPAVPAPPPPSSCYSSPPDSPRGPAGHQPPGRPGTAVVSTGRRVACLAAVTLGLSQVARGDSPIVVPWAVPMPSPVPPLPLKTACLTALPCWTGSATWQNHGLSGSAVDHNALMPNISSNISHFLRSTCSFCLTCSCSPRSPAFSPFRCGDYPFCTKTNETLRNRKVETKLCDLAQCCRSIVGHCSLSALPLPSPREEASMTSRGSVAFTVLLKEKEKEDTNVSFRTWRKVSPWGVLSCALPCPARPCLAPLRFPACLSPCPNPFEYRQPKNGRFVCWLLAVLLLFSQKDLCFPRQKWWRPRGSSFL